jgi:CelD/BcsL family acetyltransferase involved in cellulose biosynthesis
MSSALICDIEQFAALRTEWTELLASSSAESPFLTWEWLYSWWGHLRESRELAIVTVRDSNHLVAIAPFCAARRTMPFLRRWELMGTGLAGSDYLDVIVRRGFETQALRVVADTVRTHNVALHLRHLKADSFLSTLMPPLTATGWTVRDIADGVCPYIPLDGHTWDSFLATLGPSI